jgi:hypothetical protein
MTPERMAQALVLPGPSDSSCRLPGPAITGVNQRENFVNANQSLNIFEDQTFRHVEKLWRNL